MCVLTVEVLACQLLAVQLYVEAEQVLSSQQVLSSESFTQNCILSILFSFAVFYTACTNAVHVLSMYTAGI